MTFFDDVEAELSLGSISEVGESLCLGLFNLGASAHSSASGNFSKHTCRLSVSFNESFLSNMVVGKAVSALDASELATHGRSGRRLFCLGLVLGGR